MLCWVHNSTLKSESTISQRNAYGLWDQIFILLGFRKICPPQNTFALQLLLFYLFCKIERENVSGEGQGIYSRV